MLSYYSWHIENVLKVVKHCKEKFYEVQGYLHMFLCHDDLYLAGLVVVEAGLWPTTTYRMVL